MEDQPYALKLDIDIMRAKLNKMVDRGITEEVISISQELDELILVYSKLLRCQD